MSDLVTVRGFVASEVRTTLSESGCPVAHFRLASTNRKFDRQRREWIDAQTNWYSVSMFRSLAQNASVSVSKGERVIVYWSTQAAAVEQGGRASWYRPRD